MAPPVLQLFQKFGQYFFSDFNYLMTLAHLSFGTCLAVCLDTKTILDSFLVH